MNAPDDLTFLDWFAGVALIGIFAASAHPQAPGIGGCDYDSCAAEAFRIARAMLAARATPAPALDEAAIRKDERERCARAADRARDGYESRTCYGSYVPDAACASRIIAQAIRELGP